MFSGTMRSESLAECSRYKGFARLVNNNNYIVPALGQENLKEVIEVPANISGATIIRPLSIPFFNELGGRTDLLPLLQHVMMRTWASWQMSGNPEKRINTGDYELAGTINGALSRHARRCMKNLISW